MKLLKTLGLILVLLFTMNVAYAQKQRFDVVSFLLPKDWQKKQNDGGLQLSIKDDKTGAYAIAVITKAKVSSASSRENFNADWAKLVAGSVTVNGEPKIDSPVKENSWEIVSGSAHYTDSTNKGLATLLTATGGGRTVSVVLMTNSSQYQNDLLVLIKSLELEKPSLDSSTDVSPGQGNTKTNSSIVGMWCFYNTESSGNYNGFPQLTGGYFRKEYLFYADGTYLFRMKNWAAYVKEIQYVFESGTWKRNGNKLTLTPKTGKGGWWSKATSGRTEGWGPLAKKGVWKLEPVTYNVDLRHYSDTDETQLILKSPSPTEREGKQENNTLIYTPRAPNQSLIDNPPGLKTGFENKSLSVLSSSSTASAPVVSASPLAGKIWEGTSYEKLPGNGHSGGYFTSQYKLNADGTYRFIYVGASAYQKTNSLHYETGKWSVSDNQLTISPVSGVNEEWSLKGGPIRISGMSDVQIRKIKENWGAKIKSEKRKLEKVTYSFKVEYMQGNNANALILSYDKNTEREGDRNLTYYYEKSPSETVKLPAGFK